MRFWRLTPFAWLLFLILVVLATVQMTTLAAIAAEAPLPIWQDSFARTSGVRGERIAYPDQYRSLTADLDNLELVLSRAPHELITLGRGSDVVLSLPLPNGEYGRFQIVEAPIMAPELAAKYPNVKSYRGRGLDEPAATVRLSYTPLGLHAIIFGLPGGTIFIDPYTDQTPDLYLSYYRSAYRRDVPNLVEEVLGEPKNLPAFSGGGLTTGTELRIFRLALATTGEYAQFHRVEQGIGDAKTAAINAINVAMTRVNAIYEQELAVRMVLVADNDDIIFTDAATDGYSNNSGGTMLGQNQTIIDSVIGTSNYDIGHVFSTGGGGIAYLASLCNVTYKAGGVTGQPSPINDPFYVDYVSHEIGHQFGARHIFNGKEQSCTGSNREEETAFEPGSGSTIMGYAGICGSDDIQSNSDAYFNSGNFDEMAAVVASVSCGTTQPLSNVPPVVNAGADYVIPLNTPFELTGSATDGDDDSMTYAWEQHDLGPAGAPNNPSGNAPLFRSFSPVSSASRLFPQQSDLLNNTQTLGELLPSYERNMTFRLTARDGNGGVAYDTMGIQVVDSGGTFAVTAPNTAVSHTVNTPFLVTWTVADTDQPPISCASVDILLSDDDGLTFDTILLANTANDGAENVIFTTAIEEARIKVACSDNIFFDISDTAFEVLGLEVRHEASETAVSAGDMVSITTTFENKLTTSIPVSATRTFESPFQNGNCTDGLAVDTTIGPSETAVFPCQTTADPNLGLQIDAQMVSSDLASNLLTFTVTFTNPFAFTLNSVSLSNSVDASCLPASTGFAPLEEKSFSCEAPLSDMVNVVVEANGSANAGSEVTAVINGNQQIVTEIVSVSFESSEAFMFEGVGADERLYLPFVTGQ